MQHDPDKSTALALIKTHAIGPPSSEAAARLAEIGKGTHLAPELARDVIAAMLGAGKLESARSVLVMAGTRMDAIAKAMCLAREARYEAALQSQMHAVGAPEPPMTQDNLDAAKYALLAGNDKRA